ncbi:hypothetical protein V1387_02765 [Allomuricauda taeanensis]|uniref:DoxX family protein n=1 Tax=Flagellimonas taeanensis TaxID=1005926 RepID=UPI002E7BFD5A|nr:hypothetical protein [Allomuricauda taeanensis]MEE1961591.1 hypothetical protein [Allomuricauda taeanensis]
MKPFFVLLLVFVIGILAQKWLADDIDYRLAARIAMACMLTFTAIGHFAFSDGMSAMLPNFFPNKKGIIFITGLMEIVLGIGLLFPQYRYGFAWALIVFFVLVFPANIKAAIEHIDYQTGKMDGPGLSYLWFRTPLQLFFGLWVFFSAIQGK